MKKYLLIIMGIVLISSCTDFGDMNESTKAPTAVPAETLFANATKNVFDQMVSTNVNRNIFKLFSQYWTETTYTDEANYDFGRDQPGTHWNILYRDVLKDLDETRVIINNTNDGSPIALVNNRLAAISVLEVYAYHVLVDSFGNVPFTQALDPDNVSPAYDDDAAIYDAIIIKLNDAIAMFTTGEGTFGGSDLVYGGDASKWLKFANSLKLRLALRMAQVNVSTASTMASEAIAGGVFTSNADNATFAYIGASPNTNPIWVDLVESGRKDWVATNTIIDIMNNLSDSRRPIYFQENLGAGTYVGGIYGANNTFGDYTHAGDIFHQPDTEGVILDYAEVEFLMAEAIEMNLITGNAETHYNNAITASFEYWGANDVASYLANPNVAYTTASTSWQETISIQKWLALYNRGFEGWANYRIYGYPTMNIPPVSLEAVPRRYTYPEDEPSINGDSYTAAASAMGGDLKSSKVFWDVN
ncbi:SusD/RagB family nutrient-binding outer membrane lipoprotein [Lutibacter sp.]